MFVEFMGLKLNFNDVTADDIIEVLSCDDPSELNQQNLQEWHPSWIEQHECRYSPNFCSSLEAISPIGRKNPLEGTISIAL